MSDTWSDWQIVQLDECLMRGIGREEAAGLIGKSEEDIRAKVRELRLTFAEDAASPSIAPDNVEHLSRRTAAA